MYSIRQDYFVFFREEALDLTYFRRKLGKKTKFRQQHFINPFGKNNKQMFNE